MSVTKKQELCSNQEKLETKGISQINQRCKGMFLMDVVVGKADLHK